MKLALFIICFLIALGCSGQSIQDSLKQHDVADTSNPILYCGKGFAPLAYTKADKSFEKKYRIKYEILGCKITPSRDIAAFHNKAIAKILDRKYGLTWRGGMRPDVFGVTK